jgi:hypothetical protein
VVPTAIRRNIDAIRGGQSSLTPAENIRPELDTNIRSHYDKRCCLIQNFWIGAAFLSFIVSAMPVGSANAQVAAGTANDNHWHWEISLPALAPSIDGTVSFSGIPPQKVKASISDIVKNLNFALIGQVEARRNRFGFGSSLLYMSLEADVPTNGPILGQTNPRANVKALIADGFGFYRLTTKGTSAGPSTADIALSTSITTRVRAPIGRS